MKRVSAVTVRKRLSFFLFIGIIVFLIIDIRLGYVQFVLGNSLTDKARDSWSRNIPFEPERGLILDRNNVPIAENKSAPTVYIVPRQIEDPARSAEMLANVLDVPVDKVYKRMTANSSIERLPEGRKISYEKARDVRALNIKGVYIAEDSKRHYPFGRYLSHVLGFTGIDNQGLMGLELYYDEELQGKKGSVQFFSDAKGRRMPDMSDDFDPPVDGFNLRLTIDTKIQTIMERELDNAEVQYKPDGIVALAMDPNNGEILAMSSRPTFNPSEYRDVPQEIYNRNLPIWSTYEPGSTFKIITLAAALEEKKVDLEHGQFFDSGSVKVGGAKLRCWKKGGHGSQTFLEVVQNSCNPGFVELGDRLGKEKLFKYIRDFGFGAKTGIDLAGEGTGILFHMDQVGPVEQATTAFGQGVSVTPIQQVAAVAAAVNGGTLYQPYIAKELVDPATDEVVMRKSPVAKRRVISENTSKQVRHALESVVAQGTGRNAFIESFRVGGKTGTAQKAKDGRYLENNHIVSFIGFAPADDPQIVVYLAVDNPKGTIQFGGTVAAPIVGKIMEDSLRSLDVKPRKKQIEKKTTWLDPKMVTVPDLKGMTKKELLQQMLNLKLEVSGDGTTVIQQAPDPGVKVEEGSVVRIYMK
ncbi:stage V sporulation protein D [Siminovitchia sp. FSL H7-0308]|uniref:serine-type D-Ala-D-Ala carboxypeptidase n=1 Tax=Siminovitchia thermophila TaxID=1245522 RepID=A0ABS2RAD2_9BACI|nr:stage V sporulation protein D (sporulation-specific penicillin-binding protein) [Siminovitchia thermophila]